MNIHHDFAQNWQAQALAARPAILPARHFVYPAEAEEVERGALELMITPQRGAPFLATCALGFRDAAAPTGVWSCPHPEWLCAVSGGYAYLINTADPTEFRHLALRPVLGVYAAPQLGLLLFAGHHNLVAWDREGERWQSGKLSWEGITITALKQTAIEGKGWDLMTDSDTEFAISPITGERI